MSTARVARSVKLDPEIDARLTALAKRTGRTKSFYMNRAIESALEETSWPTHYRRNSRTFNSGRATSVSLDEAAEDPWPGGLSCSPSIIGHASTADLPRAEALDEELAGAIDRGEFLVGKRLGGAALDEGQDDGRVDVRSQWKHLVVHPTTGPIGKYRTARAIKLLMQVAVASHADRQQCFQGLPIARVYIGKVAGNGAGRRAPRRTTGPEGAGVISSRRNDTTSASSASLSV